jgi:dihydrofolate reductase
MGPNEMAISSGLRTYKVIVACTTDYGIGIKGTLPFKLKTDMAFFKETTTKTQRNGNVSNAVIMGRKTWESIPNKFKPLENRLNIIITRDIE